MEILHEENWVTSVMKFSTMTDAFCWFINNMDQMFAWYFFTLHDWVNHNMIYACDFKNVFICINVC